MTDWKTSAYKRYYRAFREQGMPVASAHAKALKESSATKSQTKVATSIKDTFARNLQIWAGKWAEVNGGKVVVTSGIEVIKVPGDDDHTFRIAIKCTGKQP